MQSKYLMRKEKKLFNIYVLGNPLLKKDANPLKFLPYLRKYFKNVAFQELDPTETFPEEEHLILLDTILNIKEIKILEDKAKIVCTASCFWNNLINSIIRISISLLYFKYEL